VTEGASDQKFRCSAEESFVHGPGLVINDDNTDVVDMAAFKLPQMRAASRSCSGSDSRASDHRK
jgi:hypothetical protein